MASNKITLTRGALALLVILGLLVGVPAIERPREGLGSAPTTVRITDPGSPAAENALPGARAPKWFHSYSQGVEFAKKQKRPILIAFHADWCGWCKVMDEEVLSNPEVLALLEKFVLIKVDSDKERNAALAYQVSSLPRTFLINTHDEIIADCLGYRELDDFLELLKDTLPNAEKKVNFAKMPEVRSQAAQQTAEAEDVVINEENDGELIQYLAHRDPKVRKKAAVILVKKGPEVIPLLLRALDDDYLGARLAAWKTLQDFKLPELEKNAPEFDPWASKEERTGAATELKTLLKDKTWEKQEGNTKP